jgi:putative copper resistance protein D
MIEAWIASRFIHFAAAMAVFGIAAFRLYAFVGSGIAADVPARVALDALLVRLAAAGACVALLSAVALVPFIAAEMAGSDAAALDPATWKAVLFATEFGRVWCWHLGFAAVLLALCFAPAGQWQTGASTLAALLLLVSLGWVGHAAMDMGGGISQQINQMAHLTGGGLWLGGLVPLGLLLARAVRPGGAAYVPLARTALPHFSRIGYAAVALIAVTGTANSIMLVGSFGALVATPYGRLLMVKITLFVAMVGLALVNRFRLLPRLSGPGAAMAPLRALYRSVLSEQVLGLLILAVVATLGTWPPAIESMTMR